MRDRVRGQLSCLSKGVPKYKLENEETTARVSQVTTAILHAIVEVWPS